MNPSTPPTTTIAYRRAWLLSFAAATALTLLNATTIWYGLRAGVFPNSMPYPWRWLLAENLAVWFPAALLAPMVLGLAGHLRLEREQLPRMLLIHLALTAGFHLAQTAISVPILGLMDWTNFSWTHLGWAARQRLVGRLPVNVILYWAILGAGYAVEYRSRFRRQQMEALQLEAMLAEARLQALRMQIHPHFLFNTLHAISALVDEDVRAARRMIARLSELLRLTLESGSRPEAPLGRELEALQRYLEIEQIRFQDRLVVEMEIEPEALDAVVPQLILQPIVENAVCHGVAPRAASGRINVAARRRNDMLELQVCDNGPGIPAGEMTEGIGLGNTRARLQQLYGDRGRLDICNGESGGLRVTLTIPFSLDTHDGTHSHADC
jgi:two-component system, LytTR family, sensor kinase